MGQRMERVDELLRQEIGRILARDVADPRVGFATVTGVETTPDLQHARVRISVIGGAEARAETLAALTRATGYVRRELALRLRLRRIPALQIVLDDSSERGTRVLQILEELERGDDAAGAALADAPLAESLPTPLARLPRADDAEPEPLPENAHRPDEPGEAPRLRRHRPAGRGRSPR
jgi:ribosome-binding factor A